MTTDTSIAYDYGGTQEWQERETYPKENKASRAAFRRARFRSDSRFKLTARLLRMIVRSKRLIGFWLDIREQWRCRWIAVLTSWNNSCWEQLKWTPSWTSVISTRSTIGSSSTTFLFSNRSERHLPQASPQLSGACCMLSVLEVLLAHHQAPPF